MKKNKISKSWLTKQHGDYFVRQSKIQGYRSRSAFKLIEINEKFNFLKKNTFLLDLGSSPGGWSQVARKIITEGKILAVDIKPMKKIDNVKFLEGDLENYETCDKIHSYFNTKIDVVISDMSVNTSGNKSLDSYKNGVLCLKSMDLARKILHEDGVFLSKFFMGSIFTEINNEAKNCFKKIHNYKPLASRKESNEVYIYCKGISKSFNFPKV